MAEPLLIVAQHEEDVGWTKDSPWKTWIIKKTVDIPNVGREPATYLWAIDQLWGNLPDKMAFVQGDPFDHCPNLFEELQSVEGFKALGNERFTTYADGAPTHSGIPVKEKYEKWTGKEFPGRIDFTRAGQFALTAKEIKQHPRKFYKDLHDEMLEGEVPWVFERLVGELWSK